MKKPLLLLACIFILSLSAFSQNVKILSRSEKAFNKRKSAEPFHFLESGMDTTLLAFVARLEVSSPHYPSPDALYAFLKAEAKRLGANAFSMRHHDRLNHQIIVNVYYADGKAIEANLAVKPRNVFYIFASAESPDDKTYYDFELNGAVKTIRGGTFFSYALKEGEKVKLKKGMITGTLLWLKWQHNQLAKYYSIHGYYKEPVVKRTTISKPQKQGKFYPLDTDLGAFLVYMLKTANEGASDRVK